MAVQYLEYGAKSTPIDGRYLAHNQLSIVKRAYKAADLVNGALHLINPTIVQAAHVCRVNRTYVGWAMKRTNERTDIELGWMPLVPSHPKKKSNLPVIPVVYDTAEIVEFVRKVGINRVINAAIEVENIDHMLHAAE